MQHENSAMYTFTIPPVLHFMHKGPAKSTPTLENGGASLTLNSGDAVVGGELYDFPFSFLQVTHSFNTPFTSCLPFGTQYFECNLANVALTPLRCKRSWLSRVISLVKWGLLGKMKGLLASRSKSEFTSLPSHHFALKRPSIVNESPHPSDDTHQLMQLTMLAQSYYCCNTDFTPRLDQ